MPPEPKAEKPLLEFKNICKAFGQNQANASVSFSVQRGSIHALIGENGAGKSTTVKILFGLYQKDSGDILLNGQAIHFQSPLEAKTHGFGMVHQHFMLAGPLTPLDHLFLDEKINFDKKKGFQSLWLFFRKLNRSQLRQEMEILSQKYQMPLPWDLRIQDLSVGFQQRLEILKLLRNQAEILILDEPTAVLTPQEIEALFQQLRELRKRGKTIILITHKLKEVMALADEVTVFRQGKVVAHRRIAETSSVELAELMVGQKLPAPAARSPQSPTEKAKPLLRAQNLSAPRSPTTRPLQNLNFSIHSGEILGVAGIEGNGQTELIQILLNPRKRKGSLSGDILWNEKSILNETARSLKNKGLSYFPEDRLSQGVLLDSSMNENFILGLQHSNFFSKWGWLKSAQIQQITEQEMKHFDVRPVAPQALFRTFSGGNQQKFVVARELFRKPQILIAAQPTRGVDIGAMERIHCEILKLRDQGAGILLVSSDLEELLKLSDRILVLFEGKIVGVLSQGQYNEKILGQWMLKGQLEESP